MERGLKECHCPYKNGGHFHIVTPKGWHTFTSKEEAERFIEEQSK